MANELLNVFRSVSAVIRPRLSSRQARKNAIPKKPIKVQKMSLFRTGLSIESKKAIAPIMTPPVASVAQWPMTPYTNRKSSLATDDNSKNSKRVRQRSYYVREGDNPVRLRKKASHCLIVEEALPADCLSRDAAWLAQSWAESASPAAMPLTMAVEVDVPSTM